MSESCSLESADTLLPRISVDLVIAQSPKCDRCSAIVKGPLPTWSMSGSLKCPGPWQRTCRNVVRRSVEKKKKKKKKARMLAWYSGSNLIHAQPYVKKIIKNIRTFFSAAECAHVNKPTCKRRPFVVNVNSIQDYLPACTDVVASTCQCDESS